MVTIHQEVDMRLGYAIILFGTTKSPHSSALPRQELDLEVTEAIRELVETVIDAMPVIFGFIGTHGTPLAEFLDLATVL